MKTRVIELPGLDILPVCRTVIEARNTYEQSMAAIYASLSSPDANLRYVIGIRPTPVQIVDRSREHWSLEADGPDQQGRLNFVEASPLWWLPFLFRARDRCVALIDGPYGRYFVMLDPSLELR